MNQRVSDERYHTFIEVFRDGVKKKLLRWVLAAMYLSILFFFFSDKCIFFDIKCVRNICESSTAVARGWLKKIDVEQFVQLRHLINLESL